MNKSVVDKSNESIDVVYKDACLTISKKSWIVYEIGEKKTDRILYIRVAENSGAGTFLDAWICCREIEEAISIKPVFTGECLNKLMGFAGLNTGGFVLAALVDLKLACKIDDKFYGRGLHHDFRSALKDIQLNEGEKNNR